MRTRNWLPIQGKRQYCCGRINCCAERIAKSHFLLYCRDAYKQRCNAIHRAQSINAVIKSEETKGTIQLLLLLLRTDGQRIKEYHYHCLNWFGLSSYHETINLKQCNNATMQQCAIFFHFVGYVCPRKWQFEIQKIQLRVIFNGIVYSKTLNLFISTNKKSITKSWIEYRIPHTT